MKFSLISNAVPDQEGVWGVGCGVWGKIKQPHPVRGKALLHLCMKSKKNVRRLRRPVCGTPVFMMLLANQWGVTPL